MSRQHADSRRLAVGSDEALELAPELVHRIELRRLLRQPEEPGHTPRAEGERRGRRVHAGAFEGHLREAIALNRDRAPRYAELSGGASLPVSRRLIAAETLLLPVARWFDRRAEPYHRAGVPLLAALFVPMAQAPAYGSVAAVVGVTGKRADVRPGTIRRRVGRDHRDGAFPAAAAALEREVAALSDAPEYDCLVRHLLESALRLATLAPDLVALALEQGLPSPAPLLARLFRLHLWGLGPAASLDRRARPLQARGITILAADLPPIPAGHDLARR